MRTNWQASSTGGANNWSSNTVGSHHSPISPFYFGINFEVRPFEAREFPLSEEKYNDMLTDDQKQVGTRLGNLVQWGDSISMSDF